MLTGVLISLAVFWLLFEWNFRVYRPFNKEPLDNYPAVSVLVPCRNEYPHIRENALSLLNQDYPEFEVIVFDDDSDDGTTEVLKELSEKFTNFRPIRGGKLPEGWTGKNRACHELSRAAKGEWLLFVDADTTHEPDMLRHAIQTVVHRKAAFLSTFPRQRFKTAGDELVVPLMFFIVLSYLPMYFVAKKTWPWVADFSTGCGQYMLVRKDSYEAAGGHAAIRSRISEAPLIASAVKSRGERILLLDGAPWVSCQMYRNFEQVFGGFSRSLFATMGGSVLNMTFFLVLQTFLFILPYVLLVYYLLPGSFSQTAVFYSLVAIAIPIWIRYRIHSRLGMSRRLVPLHVVSIGLYHWILLNSFVHYRFRKSTSWKDRSYGNPQC